MKPLAVRLQEWAPKEWGELVVDREGSEGRFVARFTNGGCGRGYGRTANAALNYLADGMVEEGWPDDRAECPECVLVCFLGDEWISPCAACDGTGWEPAGWPDNRHKEEEE